MIDAKGVPPYRLYPKIIEYTKEIYSQAQEESIRSNDLAAIFHLGASTSGGFVERVRSLQYYGLLEIPKKGIYVLSSLAKQLADPDNDEQQNFARKKAIFSVPLWRELYSKYPNGLPEHVWYLIKKITGLNADEAQKQEDEIVKAYHEDISFIEDQLTKDPSIDLQDNSYITAIDTTTSKEKSMSKQQEPVTSSEMTVIPFGELKVILPKYDIKRGWEKLKKFMEIELEDMEQKNKADGTSKSVSLDPFTENKETEKTKGKREEVSGTESLPGDVEYPQ